MTDKEFVETNLKNYKDTLKEIVEKFLGHELGEFFEDAVLSGDTEMAYDILFDTWEAAPDEPWIHHIPGWKLLCDICASPDFKI